MTAHTINETLKYLTQLPALMQSHSGGVASNVGTPPPPLRPVPNQPEEVAFDVKPHESASQCVGFTTGTQSLRQKSR